MQRDRRQDIGERELIAESAGGALDKMVYARVPAGYDLRVNVRIVGGRHIQLTPAALGCQPRQGAERRNADAVPLPPDLRKKFVEADKRIVEWLARESGNAKLFLDRPVEALKRAGVELTRTEEKTLARLAASANDEIMLPPDVRIESLNVSAHVGGRVGGMKPTRSAERQPTEGSKKDDCGCGQSRKED